ncbi:hypothetical protein [Ruania halotolerans]|uniref:hypothetical protein n=1 Tax=Ruania halotolerans TaxID=2897773 RepID=UPI001E518017|nr:hypothetical protein [Ruania halotolerans]UFU07340.1 hypothetical protein LQF10_04300 [Ruania halotolerans]
MRTALRSAPIAIVATALLGLAACSSPDAGSTTDEPVEAEAETADEAQVSAEDDSAEVEPAEEEPAEEAEDQSSSGAVLGIVTVDDVQYEITELRNCEPLQQEMVERELELQGFGEHDGERVQIDVYIEELAGVPYNDVAWAGPEGVYGSPDGAEVTLDAGGASVRGVATLKDAMTQTETVRVDFDLDVPADTIACR